MGYSLNAGEGTSSKITKFAPEKYNGESQTTTISEFAENVGVKSLGMGDRGLDLVFYRMDGDSELTINLPVYEPKSEKQGKFQLSSLRNTLFVFFGKKDLPDLESESWESIVLELASKFQFPSPIAEGSKLKVVLNKKGWQTVSSQYPIATSNLFAQKLEFVDSWDLTSFTKESAQATDMFATSDVPASDLIPGSDDLPF